MQKRIFDILLSVGAWFIFSPLMLFIALLIKLTQGGEVFFRQARPGLLGKPFMIVKFCSMRTARDDQGRLLPDAQRLTTLGRVLRATSLDELPELINVIRGDMSIVGPRPLLVHYLPLYSPEQARRHSVKPGITGWAQINGRNALNWGDRFRLDLWYVDNQSLRLDLKIVLTTLGKVFSCEGVTEPGQATMREFMGNHDQTPNKC